MAPISLLSTKRSTSPLELESVERANKRSKTDEPESVDEKKHSYRGVKEDLYDESSRDLLKRSVALALEHVGFDGASPEAVEAICSEADVYASMFLSKITTSMIASRRALPTPLDFQYGLQQMGLSTSSLQPHLRPPIPKDRLLIHLEPASPSTAMAPSLELLIGQELSGENDKKTRLYIPKHLPPFPSKHTYKWTEKDSIRETDARKIREEAAHQARQGEEALRRLIAVSKVGTEKGIRQIAEMDARSKQRHKLWEEAVAETLTTSGGLVDGRITDKSTSKPVERSVVVNASNVYHRKGATGKRKGVPQLPPGLLGS